MPQDSYCTLYIARHGETEWNVKGIFQGHTDIGLSANGINQAKSLCEVLKPIKIDAIYSSDLSRAKQTAEIVNIERGLAIQTSRLLRERSVGSWEGKATDEVLKAIKAGLQNLTDKTFESAQKFKLAEDVESDREIITRFITILREISTAHPQKTVLVLSHGGMMRALLKHLAYRRNGEIVEGKFGNCGYMKLISDGIDFEVKELRGFNKSAS